MRLMLAVPLLLALAACAAWDDDFSTVKKMDTTALPYESPTPRAMVVRELEPTRKVADQDCTKPFDPTLGNVRCR